MSNVRNPEFLCISSSQPFWTKLLMSFLSFCPKKVGNFNFAPFLQVQHSSTPLQPLASPHSPHSSSEKSGTGSQHGAAGGWLGEISRSIGVAETPMAAEPEAAEALNSFWCLKWPLCLKSISQKLSLYLPGKHGLKMVEDITRIRSWRSWPASWMAWMRPV